MSQCACTGRCGDDPAVIVGRQLGCARFRANRNPEQLQRRIATLRTSLQSMVILLDRLEPEVPDAQRASDEEWIAIKAAAQKILAEEVAHDC